MANFYENYQIPYDYNQVNNLYDQNHYHYNQQQQLGFEPMSYNYYNWNHSESESESVAYSGYDDPMSYNCYNWNGSESETSSASVAYSVSTMSEPKHLFYDPNLYTTTYESPPQFSIYCSVASALEFNEPEFDDYDPTPYGGGYDVVATYGKPLPPSVETCYPSSTAPHAKAPSPPEIIAPVPLGIYDGGQKNVIKKRVSFAEPVEEAKPMETIKEEEQEQDEEDEEESEEDDDYDEEEDEEAKEEERDHSSSYGNEKSETVDKGEVKALYVPSGYGLEATDLCEVIFGGYFPCVLRNKRRQEDEQDRAAAVSCWESNDSDPWKTTSDYLFGDSYPYGNENWSERSKFEISSYGYRMY
ncbi:unnamed protein product [Arabidopsis lyrata]|uniref:Uncharacterized protein n=1 Tax=Arabidopsis lyrata subsp. lyrata TaxID=81972 RepID=D7KME6_ARALL|nr:uncharacterized protein LOC9325932 [Arabidopsis lyrata subsp. lyrata]EFH66127.1 hypothetical protein ARALYDRAFT_471281 [Arabidopsis lyrata subsp. lyrata]CAH8251938.1 unnamed protein product [Arabidopsis lyrata]|eukprot:XP_002889868.1 uncharacterized protein LOC9325932 [Arabidopsis lyrata subsp. lyrata]